MPDPSPPPVVLNIKGKELKKAENKKREAGTDMNIEEMLKSKPNKDLEIQLGVSLSKSPSPA